MFATLVVVSIAYAVLLLGSSYGKVVGLAPVVANLTSVGVPRQRIPYLAPPLIAAAAGTLVGLSIRPLGIVAAVCSVIYFVLAVVAHVRSKAGNFGPPVLYLAGAVAVLTLQIATL